MKAFFWRASDDGSSYYRCTLPTAALKWNSHEVEHCDVMPESWATKSDAIVGSRVAQPKAVEVWAALDCYRVLDLDDDYLHIDPTNEAAFEFWDVAMQARLMHSISIADRVTVASEGLAEVMRQHHDDVVVVPNGLHAGLLGVPRDYDPNIVRVGWAGSTSTLQELPMAARALNRIAEYKGPAGRPVLALVGVTPDNARWAGIRTEGKVVTVPWIHGTDPYLRACNANFDIWVAPYRDTPFNRAKFPTKALEAGFLGIPLIASAVRPYEDWIDHGVNGFLVRQSHEWGRYLKMLVDDPALRQSMGEAARSRAARNVMQALALDWEQALQEGPAR